MLSLKRNSLINVSLAFILFLISSHELNFGLGSKVRWEDTEWIILKTEHFNIHYPKGYDQLAKITAIYIEEANILISEKLSHTLTQVIPVFIYHSHGQFQGTNIIPFPIDESVGGFTEIIRKRIVLPFLGSYDEWRHVITHELVHAFQYDMLMDESTFSIQFNTQRPPLWFFEGMAEYLSIGWDETAEMHIRDAIATETLPSLETLTPFSVSNGYIIYKIGQSVMNFIDKVYGIHKIGEIFRDGRIQGGFKNSIQTNIGISFREFNEKWRLWYRRKYAHLIDNELTKEKSVSVSDHAQDNSFINLHPSISPDGEKIAYMSIRNFLPAIVLRDAHPFKKKINYRLNDEDSADWRRERLLVQGGNSHKFHQLHLLDNRLSFTPDSKKLFFCVKSGGKDHLYLFDIDKKKVIQKWSPALDMIQYPKLSPDGTKAILVGSVLAQPDLYLLDLKTNALTQLTFDLFGEKDPVMSGDNQFILFSGNRNPENNFERPDYHIFEMSLKNRKVSQITFESGQQRSPMYYYHNSNHRIIYTSNQLGSPNIYITDTNDKTHYQFTNLAGGASEPTIDRKTQKIVFASLNKQSYDIMIRAGASSPDDVEETSEKPLSFDRTHYPLYGMSTADFIRESYWANFLSGKHFFYSFLYQ